MPEGWWHGRLGAIAAIETSTAEVELILAKLLAGDADGFVTWIGEKTHSLVHAYDRETRDADLETVVRLMQAKARRTLPFDTPDQTRADKSLNLDVMLPIAAEDWPQP